MKRHLATVLVWLALHPIAGAQDWTQPIRGSWVCPEGQAVAGDVVLAAGGDGCEIVVADGEHSAVRQAARFLAADIGKISGYTPPLVAAPGGRRTPVHLVTLGRGSLPPELARARLAGQWEAYQILTLAGEVWLVGSDFRGTAFAAYSLSERLGIDPLYLWTGLPPARHSPLTMRRTDCFVGPPTFRYRGLFHDDEDILPRPFDEHGYPLQTGTVPRIWYERYFETALRLRMNMVAPYVRVQRNYEIQKMASDWGLFYSSHHYDILLSNPWGFNRFGLGPARNAGDQWDWFKNRAGMMNFWRGGLLENRDLDCIWPVGLRDTQDRPYRFPEGMSDEGKNDVFRQVIDAQVGIVRELIPPEKTPIFHFTLYREMLDRYLKGKLNLPSNVIVVWTDDNDGRMLALPKGADQWKHGVYYHLAYLGGPTHLTKQVTHTVTPERVAEEFRSIVKAGATEYMLVNVSELREYVMEARMIADICWNAPAAFATPRAADRFEQWWAREYFGTAAAADVVASYGSYHRLLGSYDRIWEGSMQVHAALAALDAKMDGKPFQPPAAAILAELRQRDGAYRAAMRDLDRAGGEMEPAQRQYFFENVTLGMLIDWRQTQAALKLAAALDSGDDAVARRLCFGARDDLQELEGEILRAERPPFEHWYRKTWIRTDDSPSNVHRSYEQVLAFLVKHYLKP